MARNLGRKTAALEPENQDLKLQIYLQSKNIAMVYDKDRKMTEIMRELDLKEMDKVAGCAGGGNQITLQVIIDTLKVYPGPEFLKAMINNQSKTAAKEWVVANLPVYLAPRYPGYTPDEIRNIVSQLAVKGINSIL